MFRKCQQQLIRATVAPMLMGAKPTGISLLGRRKGGPNIDDAPFMNRTHNASIGRRVNNEDDYLEGEQQQDDDAFAAFVSARRQHIDRANGITPNAPSHLKPINKPINSNNTNKSAAASSASNNNMNDNATNVVPPSALKGTGKRIVVNAGGQLFETFEGTLLQYPQTAFGQMILEQIVSAGDEEIHAAERAAASSSSVNSNTKNKLEIFIDVDPKVFNFVLQFLRSGKCVLPTDDEPLRFAINTALQEFGLLDVAFPPIHANAADGEADGAADDEAVPLVRLPDVCVIQMCDHLQHDQGVKRHALNISYGSDGFSVRDLCKKVRKDLNGQLSNTYWQCYQTHERSMFLITTKIANGTADLMMSSVTQRVIEHTEQQMGYRLVSSYVTLSPDIKNTNVRLFIHNLIFRRVRNPSIEDTDAIQLFANPDGSIAAAMGVVSGMQHQTNMKNRSDETFVPNEEMFKNFEAPTVGPQDSYGKLGMPLTAPAGQRVPGNIWDE